MHIINLSFLIGASLRGWRRPYIFQKRPNGNWKSDRLNLHNLTESVKVNAYDKLVPYIFLQSKHKNLTKAIKIIIINLKVNYLKVNYQKGV